MATCGASATVSTTRLRLGILYVSAKESQTSPATACTRSPIGLAPAPQKSHSRSTSLTSDQLGTTQGLHRGGTAVYFDTTWAWP